MAIWPVGLLQCNCVILYDANTVSMVDPGGDPERLVYFCQSRHLILDSILITHAHIDHIMGIHALKKHYPNVKIYLQKNDDFLYKNIEMQAEFLGWPEVIKQPDYSHTLEHEMMVNMGCATCKVIHTPGHTPGSVCFYVEMPEGPLLLSGDTLFDGSIGRTDLWGGNYEQILDSIQNHLMILDNKTRVIPGHGSETTIRKERTSNPFLI